MARVKSSLRVSPRMLFAPLTIVIVTLVLMLLWTTPWNKRSERLTITGGSGAGRRHAIAETLGRYAAREGIALDVVATAGSRDALRKVDDGEIDFALAQGGLANTEYPNVRQVAVLHIEPLHLLVKPHATFGENDHLTLTDLADGFVGRPNLSINVSDKGSGTYALSTVLLKFFGLSAGEDFEAKTLRYKDITKPGVSTEELPDAVFTVSSLPSPVARHLILEHGYRPVELPMAEAFRLDWSQVNGAVEDGEVIRQHIVEATIPAFTYQVSPPVPATPIKTLGTRMHLVANKNTSAAAVERVADSVYDSTFASLAQPPISVTLLQTASEFELHDGAANYVKWKTPIITENMVEHTEQVLAILGSLFAGVLFVWQGLLFVRRRRRDRQFLQCIERVGEIEQKTFEFERDDEMNVEMLVVLQGELNQIKSDIIHQFQSGDIEGADTLSSFLMHVNDANENLTRMILHERSPRPASDLR